MQLERITLDAEIPPAQVVHRDIGLLNWDWLDKGLVHILVASSLNLIDCYGRATKQGMEHVRMDYYYQVFLAPSNPFIGG